MHNDDILRQRIRRQIGRDLQIVRDADDLRAVIHAIPHGSTVVSYPPRHHRHQCRPRRHPHHTQLMPSTMALTHDPRRHRRAMRRVTDASGFQPIRTTLPRKVLTTRKLRPLQIRMILIHPRINQAHLHPRTPLRRNTSRRKPIPQPPLRLTRRLLGGNLICHRCCHPRQHAAQSQSGRHTHTRPTSPHLYASVENDCVLPSVAPAAEPLLSACFSAIFNFISPSV